MNPVPLFRLLAVGSWALALLAGGIDLVPGLVPESLLKAFDETVQQGQLFLVAIAAIVLVLAGLIATIGLVLFASWSRALALTWTVAAIAYHPATPAMVQSGWAAMFYYASALTWGAALSMAYFSPLAQRFVRAS